jgi:hypothetical protein
MTTADHPDVQETTSTGGSPWGIGGMVLGFLAFAMAVLAPLVWHAAEPPPPAEPKMADILADAGAKFVDKMVNKVRGHKPAAAMAAPAAKKPLPWPLIWSIAATSLGIVATGAGSVSWIRREDKRIASSAVAAGGLAIAWNYVVVALVIALVIIFLLIVASALSVFS